LKIVANERLVLQKVDEFVGKHNVDCDFFHTSTFDVCMTPEFAEYEAASLQAYKDAGGDVSHINFYDGVEAQERSKVDGAVAAYEWPAGSSHPAKLAQWLLKSVVDRGVKLFTLCPATAIRSADNNITSKTWSIQTPRGVVSTPTIIHCTNAHASLLLPDLAQHVIPNCAQAHAITPSPAFSAEKTLTKTYSLRYSLLHFFSLIQRQTDGTLILGTSRTNPEFSQKTLDGIQSIDDTIFNEEIAEKSFEAFKRLFPSYEGTNGLVHGEGMQHVWSGIIAMTTDSVPFVGAIESLPGQYICAGFGGHGRLAVSSSSSLLTKLGMARIFTCAPGVAKLVLGKQWAETGLPECFQISKERLSQLENKVCTPVW
jgi:glycine/D-amino acid oxidase-like deaminating enzyme